MLKKFILSFIFLNSLLSYAQSEKKLAEAFIQSVANNNFNLLQPYLYNAAVAKKLFAAEFNKATPAKQAEAMKKYKTGLQKKWGTAVSNARSNKIDFKNVKVKQVLSAPLEGVDIFNSLLITYEYNGAEWDDLFLIINKQGASKYIIDIPSDTRMFAVDHDRKGKNLEHMQQQKDKTDPNIKQHLRDAVEKLKKLVAANDMQQLYANLVYSGEEDKENRWKRTIDPSKPGEVQTAKQTFEKLKYGFAKCDKINYGEVRMEKESEGVWYVINSTCGNQKHTYAFLKINNTFVLGDSD